MNKAACQGARVPGWAHIGSGATLVTGSQLRCLYRNTLWPQVSFLPVTIGQRSSHLCPCCQAQVVLEIEEGKGVELPSMHWVPCLSVVSQLVQTPCTGMAAWLE